MRRNRRAIAGFTLIELLLAIAIGAIILGGVSSTLFSLTSAQEYVEKITDRDRVGRRLLFRLRREAAAGLLTHPDGPVTGSDGGDFDGVEIRTGAYGAPARVRYFWKDGILWREQIDPSLLETPSPVALRQVTGFNIRYFSDGVWKESWSGNVPPLGISVLVTIDGREYGSVIAL